MEEHASFAANLANWNERVGAHAGSPDYRIHRFAEDPSYLSDVVRFDLPRLGDISGLDVVHLQCHIGTDTASLARLGARVCGLDFSAPALDIARSIATSAGLDVGFVHANVYDAPAAFDGRTFDLVYTGIGALNWLPNIERWAAVVAALLRPGGRLFIRESHPMLFTIADARPDGLLVVDYPYFERPEPLQLDSEGTYVRTDEPVTLTNSVTHEWNHGLAEIITSLMNAGMRLTAIEEHDTVPWQALIGQMDELPNGEWRLRDRPERVAMSYTLQAVKDR